MLDKELKTGPVGGDRLRKQIGPLTGRKKSFEGEKAFSNLNFL